MPLVWVNGNAFDKLDAQIQIRRLYILEQCEKALSICVKHGAENLIDGLEKATTKTGDKREAAGTGVAGRHRSGLMVNSVNHNGDNLEHLGPVIVGSFGWFANTFQEYFEQQDKGDGELRIPPAAAMMHAASVAQAEFRLYMHGIVNGVPVE